MLMLERIRDSYIYYDTEYLIYVREYYLYSLKLIKSALEQEEYHFNIIFGNYRFKFPNRNKTFKIDIQFEHTLVKPGGRDSSNSVSGNIKINETTYYLIRLHNYSYYKTLDYTIDYSIPNLMNIRSNNKFKIYSNKITCISPLLYSFKKRHFKQVRDKNIITTFINPDEPRRKALLDNLKQSGIGVNNIVNHFSKEDIQRLYSTSRILINIHQTPYHDTFEELRVLPALLCGCIVVSENVPLKEFIPYHEYILWTNYDSIVDVVREVNANYNFYFNKIFNDKRLEELLKLMEKQNMENVNHMISTFNVSNNKSKVKINRLLKRIFWNINYSVVQ